MNAYSQIRYGSLYEVKRVFHSIPEGTGEEVLQTPDARYYDTSRETRLVAVKRMYVLGAERDVVVAYDLEDDIATLVTVFPLKEGQQQNRRESGRWVTYEPASGL